jgi:ABC-type Fe3+ transport system permease subunit
VTSAFRPFAIPAALWLLLIGAAPLLRLLAEALGGSAVAVALGDPAIWRAAWRSLTVSLAAGRWPGRCCCAACPGGACSCSWQ